MVVYFVVMDGVVTLLVSWRACLEREIGASLFSVSADLANLSSGMRTLYASYMVFNINATDQALNVHVGPDMYGEQWIKTKTTISVLSITDNFLMVLHLHSEKTRRNVNKQTDPCCTRTS